MPSRAVRRGPSIPELGSSMTTHHETLVVGAGPAGLQLGYFLERRGRDYLLLEAGEGPGTFFRTYPRHRLLISINKLHTGSDDPEIQMRHDWNSLLTEGEGPLLKEHSTAFFPPADVLPEYLRAYAERNGIRVRYRMSVSRISRDGARFVVESADGERFTSDRLVMATGVSRPYVPDIPGIELAEGYEEVSVDPAGFANQRVLVIGKGNSAFETADNLAGAAALIHVVSPSPVRMAWRTHYVGDLRAINNNFLDTYQLKSQNAVLDARVERIVPRPGGGLTVTFAYVHAEGEVEDLGYDRVIRCTGFRFDAAPFDASAAPELAVNARFPVLTCEWESVNQPGLYFAGTIMQELGYRQATSGFIHGFRYNIRTLDRILESRYHGTPWPVETVPLQPEALCDRVLARVNRTSDLWQQQSFLGDVLRVQGGAVECREGLPVAYIREKFAEAGEHCFMLTLEFGKLHDAHDPFASPRRRSDCGEHAEDSLFLHPVIREFQGGAQVSEHHVMEHLEARWTDDVAHVQPLLGWFRHRLGRVRVPVGRTVREPAGDPGALEPAGD
jgi:thioredoxin reductase